MTYLHSL